MELFKESKKAPIKFRNFKFIGYHKDYPCAYYYKALPNNNFELMELMLEGNRLPEIGAGTSVKVIDAFMANYLANIGKRKKDIIKETINTSYSNLTDEQKSAIHEKFTSRVPNEIEQLSEVYKGFTKNGYKVLYCANDESKDRIMGIVNIVLVKEEEVVSKDKRIDINRKYTLFKPLKFMVKPSYTKGASHTKYFEEESPTIVVSHDILK